MLIHRFIRDLDALGIPVPSEVAAVQAIRHAINGLVFTPPIQSFEDDLAAGKITADTAVKRVRDAARQLIEHEKAVQVSRDAEPTLVRLERRALGASGDSLVDALRPAFDQAATATSTFIERFGTNPAAETVLAAPGGSEAWQAQQSALAFFDRCRRLCTDLAGVYYGPEAPTWYLADVADADALRRAVSIHANTARSFGDLVAAGYSLRLNTNEEAEAIVAKTRTVAAEKAAARQAEGDEAKAKAKAERVRLDEESIEQAKAMRQRVGLAP